MECKVCLEIYNDSNRKPKIITNCGHTFCSNCLNSLNIKSCPKCRNKIIDCVINYDILELITNDSNKIEFQNTQLLKEYLIKDLELNINNYFLKLNEFEKKLLTLNDDDNEFNKSKIQNCFSKDKYSIENKLQTLKNEINTIQINDFKELANEITTKIKLKLMKIQSIDDYLNNEKILKILNDYFQYSQKDSSICLQTLVGHTFTVNSLAVVGDNKLASGSADGSIRIWESTNGTTIKILNTYLSSDIFCLKMLPNGYLASGSSDKTIKIWDIDSGKCLKVLTGHIGWVYTICVLSNHLIASGSYDKTIRIWNIVDGKIVKILIGHSESITCLEIVSNELLASGSRDRTIRIWNIENGLNVAILTGHTDYILSLVLLPSGYLASGSWDHSIKIWNVLSGQLVKTLNGHEHAVISLCVLKKRFLTSGSYKEMRIWDIDKAEVIEVINAHENSVWSMAELEDGTLASASDDWSIKIWKIFN